MDTKWRNSNIGKIFRFILVLIIIASLTVSVMFFKEFIENSDWNLSILVEESYIYSNEFINDKSNITNNLISLINLYRNEEYIRSGKAISEEDVMYSGGNLSYEETYEAFMNSDKYNYDLTELENFSKYKELYPENVENIKKYIIKEQLISYNNILKSLERLENVNYYATNGKDVYTNNKELELKDYLKNPAYITYDYANGYLEFSKDEKNRNHTLESEFSEIGFNEDVRIYIGFTDKYFDEIHASWSKEKEMVQDVLNKFLISISITIISFIAYIGLLPSKEEDGERFIDKPYTDISILIALSLIGIWFAIMSEFYSNDVLIKVMTIVIAILGLLTVTSIVRNIKNKRFFSHSLIYKIFSSIKNVFVDFFGGIYRGNRPERKAVILTIVYSIILLLTFFMFPVTIFFGAWWVLRRSRDFTKIKDGVEKIKNGELTHKIKIEKEGEFKELADNINTISDGLDRAIDNELKSERLKTELITNVSHDIRTPLTSIITYIDLLKNETNEEKRKEYVEILEAKSLRLKALTDDLFEASKVSSGSIPVNIKKIDIVSLLTQGLGELNDKISENDLDFIVNSEFDEINVWGDGDLLWRAIENLLSNIFKYSLKGSRIYIDIEEKTDTVELTMKNISAYKLNITAEELLERFKRGDESRTSEGSGLGLSITESLIELQAGEFKLEIDGDLFKTIIVLPRYK